MRAWTSAANLSKQWCQGEQSLDVLKFIGAGIVYTAELSQQAHQLCIQKPLEEGAGLPGK